VLDSVMSGNAEESRENMLRHLRRREEARKRVVEPTEEVRSDNIL